MATKIYTKTGDDGTTGLFGGGRRSKDDIRIESYGSVDELNSYIGLLLTDLKIDEAVLLLQTVQKDLFTMGSHLAMDPEKEMTLPTFPFERITDFEKQIDEMNNVLPALKHFILPGGSQSAAHCQIARTVCRRAERNVVSLATIEVVDPVIVQYLNRFSDYLFVLSRMILFKSGIEETKWLP